MTEIDTDALFSKLFDEGITNLIVGRKGSGKTTLAVWFMVWLLQHGYKVVTNILFKEVTGYDEKGRQNFKEKFPEDVTKVRNFLQLMKWIGDELDKDRYCRLVFIIDEAGVSISATKPVMAIQPRAFSYWSQLSRKFNCNMLMITVTPKLIMKSLREADSGFLGATLNKMPQALTRYAKKALAEHDARELFVLDWEDYKEHDDDVEVFHIEGVTELPYCKPQKLAKLGDIVFSSKSSATFTMGKYPNTEVVFSVEECLDYISDVIEEDVSQRILAYINAHGFVDQVEEGVITTAKPGSAEFKRAHLSRVNQIVSELKEENIPERQWPKEVASRSTLSEKTARRYLKQLGF